MIMINPIAFSLYGFPIRWYGIAYLVTFLISLQLAKYYTRFLKNINTHDIERLLNFIVIGVIVGGRIGEFIFYTPFSSEILRIWEGGMSFHGGVIGTGIAIFLYSKIYKKHVLQISDIVALCTPIGCFLGRIANFINQEVIGRKSLFLQQHFAVERHPVVFYEAFLEGIVLFYILLKPKRFTNEGATTGLFLFFYGLFRITTEFFRVPDGIIGPLTTGQALSIPMVIIGSTIYLTRK